MRARFTDFQRGARDVGLTDPADQSAVFGRLPETVQAAYWADLAHEVDRERREAGWVA